MLERYIKFLADLDEKLRLYFEKHAEHICCIEGCSSCCEKGDYPLSQIELEYLMQGFVALDNETKQKIQKNVQNMEKGGACPFLVNKMCSVYPYRPIVCRVHGIAYLCKDKTVKLPYCANEGKNYSKVYKDGMIEINPVLENLDTPKILQIMDSEKIYPIKNMYDWLKREW